MAMINGLMPGVLTYTPQRAFTNTALENCNPILHFPGYGKQNVYLR
jgi:hypothetical protein